MSVGRVLFCFFFIIIFFGATNERKGGTKKRIHRSKTEWTVWMHERIELHKGSIIIMHRNTHVRQICHTLSLMHRSRAYSTHTARHTHTHAHIHRHNNFNIDVGCFTISKATHKLSILDTQPILPYLFVLWINKILCAEWNNYDGLVFVFARALCLYARPGIRATLKQKRYAVGVCVSVSNIVYHLQTHR